MTSASSRSAEQAPREVLDPSGNVQPPSARDALSQRERCRTPNDSAGADEHPYPKRRRSQKLRWPRYGPAHDEPFIADVDMSAEDWRQVYKFMANRRQLALVDLSPKLRAQFTAEMPALIAYFDERRIDAFYCNRAHTVGFERKRKSPPVLPSTVAPADQLSDLERALSASIAAAESQRSDA